MRVGFYETDITPPLGCKIPGYFFERIACGVSQKLSAKAVVLENDGVYAALVCMDALGLPVGLPQIVRSSITERTPLAPEAILLTATHAHTGLPEEGEKAYPNGDKQAGDELIRLIALKTADAAVLAYQRLQEADVFYACEEVVGVSFIRNYLLKNGEYRTNPFDYIDEVVRPAREPRRPFPFLLFKDKNGQPIGSVSCFAVHHDTVGTSEYSSDYSGLLARYLKEEYGLDFVSVYLPGFSGDMNTLDFRKKDPRGIATKEVADALFASFKKMAPAAEKLTDTSIAFKMDTARVDKRIIPDGFVDSVKEVLKGPAPEPKYDDQGNQIDDITDPYCDAQKYASGEIILKTYDEDKRKQLDLPVQAIKFGDCMFYGLVGEQFSEFAENICDGSPTTRNFTAELCHDYSEVSYFPTAHMFHPHVYESTYYSARFEPDTGDRMVKRVLELAHEIY